MSESTNDELLKLCKHDLELRHCTRCLRELPARIDVLERNLATAIGALEKIQDCYLCDTGACDGNSVHKFVIQALKAIQE